MKLPRLFMLLCCIFVLVTISIIKTPSLQAQHQTLLSFEPITYKATQLNEIFDISLTVKNVNNLWGWTAAITWDPAYLTLVGNPIEGEFLKQAGATLFVAAPPKNGTIPEITCGIMAATGVSGSGVLAKLTFKVIKECIETPINLVNTTLLTPEIDYSKPHGHKEIPHRTQSATITLILGGKPVAHAGYPQTVDEGTQVTFNASKTTPITEDLKFIWTFFDNGPKILEGIIAYYTFEVPGVYIVTLTVENSKGEKSNATVQITVRDITPPVAKIVIEGIGPGYTVALGQRITLDASQSYDPEGGKIQKYLWNLGDGNVATAESLTYQYIKAGIYTVALTVFDQRGNNSATEKVVITVVSQESPQSLKLPPLATWILIATTSLVIFGSAFWLRKRPPNSMLSSKIFPNW